MKKIVVLCMVVCLLVGALIGCAQPNPRTRALVVVNDTDDREITVIGVTSYHGDSRKLNYNLLPDESPLHPGESLTVHLPPLLAEVEVFVQSFSSNGDPTVFTYTWASLRERSIVGDHRDDIVARYTLAGTDYRIEFGGSGYQKLDEK